MSSLMGSALPSEAVSAQQKAFVTYTFPERPDSSEPGRDPTVTLLEARSVISASGTTGLRTWEAALVLGSYLSSTDGRQIVRGKTILELGAGTGMLSILCAKYLDVTGVTATDGDEGVVDAIKTNAFLNGLDPDQPDNTILQSAVLRWGWPINKSTFQEDYGMEIPDVLLGADLVSRLPLLLTAPATSLTLGPGVSIPSDISRSITHLSCCGLNMKHQRSYKPIELRITTDV